MPSIERRSISILSIELYVDGMASVRFNGCYYRWQVKCRVKGVTSDGRGHFCFQLVLQLETIIKINDILVNKMIGQPTIPDTIQKN